MAGAMTTSRARSHWAILVGVDVAFNHGPATAAAIAEGNPSERLEPLKGAGADAAAVSDFLQDEPDVKVVKLTSTITPATQRDLPPRMAPQEAPEHLATADNFRLALEAAIDGARSGVIKQVYIHFSGHGTRIQQEDGALALVMYHKLASKSRPSCFRSSELAAEIQKMTMLGVRVTLVLDCCFSGSVKREGSSRSPSARDCGVRFWECDAAMDVNLDMTKEDEPTLPHLLHLSLPQGDHDDTEHRGATWRVDSTLLDAHYYLVLAACTPSQMSREVQFSDSQVYRGALSYFLDRSLRLLRHAGAKISGDTLFRHIQASFHAQFPSQSPMRYGSSDVCFFTDLISGSRSLYVSVFRKSAVASDPTTTTTTESSMILNAGQAHGVHVGDEYRAYPYHATEIARQTSSDEDYERRSAIALRVSVVESLSSAVEVVDSSQASRLTRASSSSTWKAEPVSSASPHRPYVQIGSGVPEVVRKGLREELTSHPFMQFSSDAGQGQGPILFNVGLDHNDDDDDNDAYTVTDNAPAHASSYIFPTIPAVSEKAAASLAAILRHMTGFKFFESIETTDGDPLFESSFTLESSEPGPDGYHDVQHGQVWKLKFSNLHETEPRYITLFNFRSSWEVCNVISEAGGGEFLEIGPKQSMDLPVTMKVPSYLEEEGAKQSVDVMKIFVTSRATSYPRVILPKLADADFRNHGADIRHYDFLNNWMSGMAYFRDGSVDRWTTQNYLVRTSVSEEGAA